MSDVPFDGPMSEVRVARVNGEFVINPLRSELETADMDIMVAGTMDSIVMVEGEMQEVSEGEMVDAIEKAHEAIKAQCEAQNELAKKSVPSETSASTTTKPTTKNCAVASKTRCTPSSTKRARLAPPRKAQVSLLW